MLQYRQEMMVVTWTRVVVEVGRSESLADFGSNVDGGNVRRGVRITQFQRCEEWKFLFNSLKFVNCPSKLHSHENSLQIEYLVIANAHFPTGHVRFVKVITSKGRLTFSL